MKRILTLVLMNLLLVNASFSEELIHSDKKLDSLIVYGKDFRFSVKEPKGWYGDTKSAERYSANIIFSPISQKAETNQVVIRVLISDKTDENIQEDLAHDMGEYHSKYANVQFKELAISHPEYVVFPKLFTVPNEFYEYVSYVNPGPKNKLMFSVSMNKQKKEASASELDAYQKIVASLQML